MNRNRGETMEIVNNKCGEVSITKKSHQGKSSSQLLWITVSCDHLDPSA